MDSEQYKLVDSVVGDKQFSLKEGKQFVPEEGKHQPLGEDKHQTLGEDKVVVLEDPKWDFGHLDKVFQKIVQKEQDLILLLVGYGMIDPQGRVD